MSKALYRKYRSKSLGEILGQTHVTDILTRSLEQNRISHAYLLTGPRGTGKTSIARILAHEINHLPYNDDSYHLDIIEIDAASNNGVEDIRDLREKVQIAPVSAAKKIYIIDEVHMLSKQAFNALLKTLEEPPEHAVFILATTDSDKLPATIISRVQRFNLRLISPDNIVKHLTHITKEEGIKIDNDALELIALHGNGSFRDSISLLDQLQHVADKDKVITRSLVEQSLGLAPTDLVEKLLIAYEAKNLTDLVTLLDESQSSGIQANILADQLLHYIRKEIIKKPQLLELLDELTFVSKSTQPHIKLLTVLARHAVPHTKPKTAALEVTAAPRSSPLEKLVKEASKPVPQEIITPTITPTSSSSTPLEFEWEKLIAHTKSNFVAIYSVLSKCGYEVEGNLLRLYVGNAFYKKKLDDPKHRVSLVKALAEIAPGEWIFDILPTSAPIKDSQAAAVAAIMGGGQEVEVE
jgi:DNA polymerase III subunit gamma/tau